MDPAFASGLASFGSEQQIRRERVVEILGFLDLGARLDFTETVANQKLGPSDSGKRIGSRSASSSRTASSSSSSPFRVRWPLTTARLSLGGTRDSCFSDRMMNYTCPPTGFTLLSSMRASAAVESAVLKTRSASTAFRT